VTRSTSTSRRDTARGRLVRLVLLAVVGALGLTGCDFSVYSLPLPGGADLGDNPYRVTVEFRDVLDLVPQSAVKVDDVSVGKVDSIDVRGYHAEVTLLVRRSVKLPGNAVATIRQTSLLGEKFVSLAPPDTGASSDRLGDGDVIPLSRSGRNPEVEEVLGALSLLLNGGGVAQLKTIATELNRALAGREGNVRSVLDRLKTFTAQLDTGKDQIVRAIESLNRLAVSLRQQEGSVKLALDELPGAIASINRQRDDLVRMLQALARLSSVATHVIRDSKAATIDSLQALAPTLEKLAEAGDAFPKSLQVFLTYPFVDAVVGENPAQARNLHMGDYTNLSVQMDASLAELSNNNPGLPGPGQVCKVIPQIGKLCGKALDAVLACLKNPGPNNPACKGLPARLLRAVCGALGGPVGGLCGKVPTVPGVPNTPTPSQLTKCLQSGKPQGAACDKVNPLVIARHCTATNKRPKPSGYYSDTCKAYRRLGLGVLDNGTIGKLPGVGGGTGGGGGGGGLLGGLGRPAFGPTRSPAKSTAPSHGDSDLAAMLMWGMVQR
jgi:phospholipid/cholesterol/gamma-HCH transport system substrate-binding protein